MNISVNLLIEDEIHEHLIKKILLESQKNIFSIDTIMGRRGNSYIKDRLSKFNQHCRQIPYIVLTDLDEHICPIMLINKWVTFKKHHNMIFRIAVREGEAWLLADKKNMAIFLAVPESKIPSDIESIHDPKGLLIQIARKSKKKDIRDDLVPTGSARIGKAYNSSLGKFIVDHWDVKNAVKNSDSLKRFLKALDSFTPI